VSQQLQVQVCLSTLREYFDQYLESTAMCSGGSANGRASPARAATVAPRTETENTNSFQAQNKHSCLHPAKLTPVCGAHFKYPSLFIVLIIFGGVGVDNKDRGDQTPMLEINHRRPLP
jgi:hypothetical protein